MCVIDADADKLRQALVNLISNAISHTPANGNVIIRLRPESTRVRIEVRDEGPGIPEEDIPFVFDRFWRGDKSRNRSEGGSGLGLSHCPTNNNHAWGRSFAEIDTGKGQPLYRVFTLTGRAKGQGDRLESHSNSVQCNWFAFSYQCF